MGHLFLFSCTVVSDSLQHHGLEHARLSRPLPPPGVCSNLCPSEKAVATHSSVLAWRIPGMGEPDGLPSMGLHSRT